MLLQTNWKLVLGYGDPVDNDAVDQFPNVKRKMQAMDLGSSLPLFVSPRVDISEYVAELVMQRRREKARW